MKIQVSKFLDYDWTSLIERMQGVIELLKKEHTIIGITTMHASHLYHGVIFYEVTPERKQPAVAAKVIPIDRWVSANVNGKPYIRDGELVAPGGCVSLPDQHFEDNQKVLKTLSEQLQEDLEPITDHGKRFCV